ncbi:MAG TPA: DUF1287 domain-containing protein [Kofleriaceae bacterium]|nr:DUF1287 domain-containing protein [Kofleriaceae bacterium]
MSRTFDRYTHHQDKVPSGGMTPGERSGSAFFLLLATHLISLGCGARGEADPAPPTRPLSAAAAPGTPGTPAAPTPGARAPLPASEGASRDPGVPGETCLGVADKGIWSDLDDKIQIALPKDLTPDRVSARLDRKHALLVLVIDGFPRKAYPLAGAATLTIGSHELALRPGDRTELAKLLTAERVTEAAAAHDADGDGIPDPLDVLIGAKKTVVNADAYTEGYITMKFPMGDVPREVGVCTDVIVRAVRNAGVDLQKALYDDILRARGAYPMIRTKPDPQIDQRRVATLLPYFLRHWEKHTARLDDPADPLRPGDVLFMDTFPSRSGPDHVGIVSDTIGPAGLPMIINNWTNGTVTAEMDLLTFVPVLYRFRLPAT